MPNFWFSSGNFALVPSCAAMLSPFEKEKGDRRRSALHRLLYGTASTSDYGAVRLGRASADTRDAKL